MVNLSPAKKIVEMDSKLACVHFWVLNLRHVRPNFQKCQALVLHTTSQIGHLKLKGGFESFGCSSHIYIEMMYIG